MPGPSGYSTAFSHPDPMDPNDVQRQRTQSAAPEYPYDRPTSYGKATGTDMDGGSYQIDGGDGPPPGEEQDPDRPMSVWDRLSDSMDLEPVEIGPQGRGADELGYGSHGLRGETLVIASDEDDLLDLKAAFVDMLCPDDEPEAPAGDLVSLLMAQELDTDADGEDPGSDDMYDQWPVYSAIWGDD